MQYVNITPYGYPVKIVWTGKFKTEEIAEPKMLVWLSSSVQIPVVRTVQSPIQTVPR